MFSNTFAGIAPSSVAPFVLMQLVGGLLGYALIRALYPNTAAIAAEAVTQPDERPSHDPTKADRAVRLRPQRRSLADGRWLAQGAGR